MVDNCVVSDVMESSRITLPAQLISTVLRRVERKIRWTGDGAGGIEGSEDDSTVSRRQSGDSSLVSESEGEITSSTGAHSTGMEA